MNLPAEKRVRGKTLVHERVEGEVIERKRERKREEWTRRKKRKRSGELSRD